MAQNIERFMQTEDMRRMEAICQLNGRSIAVIRQADNILAVYNFLKFTNLNSKKIYGVHGSLPDMWPVFEGNAIVP